MTNVYKAIRTYLLTKAPVTALLQGGIWPIQVPKASRARPAISIQCLSSLAYENISSVPTLERTMFAVKVWVKQEDYDAGAELMEKVRAALVGTRTTLSGLDCQGIMQTGVYANYKDPDTEDYYFVKHFYIMHGVIS